MKKAALVGVVVCALALSACGASSVAAKKASLRANVQSLGATQNLQVTLHVSVAGAGTSKDDSVLKTLTFTIDLTNPDGRPLSQSGTNRDAALVVEVHGTKLVDVRDVNSNLYGEADFLNLARIPTVDLSSAELGDLNDLFGGHWFELQDSVLNGYVPKKDSSGAHVAESQRAYEELIDAISNLIVTSKYTSSGSDTYSESGTLYSFAEALLPVIRRLSPPHDTVTSPTKGQVKGSYTLSVTTTGSVALGMSVSVTEPNGHKDATVTISATFSHADDVVTAPSGATLITKAFITSLKESGL